MTSPDDASGSPSQDATADDASTDSSNTNSSSSGGNASVSDGKKSDVLIGLIGIVVGAVIAGGFSWLAAWQQSRSTEKAQESQAQEERRSEEREKRAEVYSKFLNSADRFAVETSDAISNCTKKIPCKFDRSAWDEARSAYQGSLNSVYVYGSYDAVNASRAVSASLPKSLWDPPPTSPRIEFQEERFIDAYNEFQLVMCQELPPRPRDSC
ncbi:hypothetical protein [Streptomyces lomondensis]|uniref:Uncharacterized protein n=1 Tax=Streptomyces lomondensis TaxID=68229 RepID=A0ABQ2XLU1_9ACTN|nr:hypothetical protein [Streptomyces lomondensis]MCF0076504.1 hypothetical protein [Streptomyces lomondensis]GGX24047.1 hypothetical protein GCM10010383_62960 [Streptomyces lomondensis]